jgi:hypothetical protein
MSSLWSLIRKHGEIGYDPEVYSAPDADRIFSAMFASIKAQPHLINISTQADEWCENRTTSEVDFATLDATPCFAHLWLEWTSARRYGVLIRRHPATQGLDDAIQSSGRKMIRPVSNSKYLVQMSFFGEFEGRAEFHGVVQFYIDATGHPLGGYEISAHEDDKEALTSMAFMVADVLTTMNTLGTRIQPPLIDRHAQVVKPTREPCSVWHTIHLPAFARPPLGGAIISPEMLERRDHWVRGHRKDYRQGHGMFGRIKALVWVPEFQRGNPELGTVKQRYIIGPCLETDRHAGRAARPGDR